MIWLLYIGGGVLALFALLMLWGVLHLQQSRRKASREIQRIELADIKPLAKECVAIFQKKLGVRLSPDDCEGSAQKLDDAFRDQYKLKGAFERDGFYWYFVKPVGAFLGELLRLHARHEWRKSGGQSPSMELKLNEGSSEVYPFDKVLKHTMSGGPGDLVAYVALACTLARDADQVHGADN